MAKNEDIKRKTIDVASRLFAEKGYDGVSMRDIAAKVGVTVGNLYYYFPNKSALILDTLESCFSQAMQTFYDEVPEEGTPKERFEAMIYWIMRLLYRDSVFSKLFLREKIEDDVDRIELLMKKVFYDTMWDYDKIIAAYAKRGDRQTNFVMSTSLVWGSFQMARSFHISYEQNVFKPDPDKMAKEIIEFLSRAYGVT